MTSNKATKESIAKRNPQMVHNQRRTNIAVRSSHRRRFKFSRWCSKASRTTSNNQERNQQRNQQKNQQRNHPRTEEYLVYRKYTSSKAVIGCLLLFSLYTYPQTLLLQKHFNQERNQQRNQQRNHPRTGILAIEKIPHLKQ